MQRVMQKCGGYRNFILRSKDLAVVDKIVAAKTDLRNAQELAFKVNDQLILHLWPVFMILLGNIQQPAARRPRG